jgi:thioredoxin-related protein
MLFRLSYILILLGLHTFSYSQETFQEAPDFIRIQKQATESEKKIMIVCCTEWCGPCKTLKTVHLKDSSVRAFVDSNYIIAWYDMEKGFGVTVAKKYGVVSYPTIIILNSGGKMLSRIEGVFSNVAYLLDALKSASGIRESLYPGVSVSLNLAFPQFYNDFFESKKKEKVQTDVVDAYLNSQKDLFSEVNWRIMLTYETGPKFDTFIYNNYPKLKNLYGPEAELKINKIISKKLQQTVSSKDTVQFQKLISFMQANQFSEKHILERKLYFYGKTALDWSEYTKLLNRYMSTFDESLIGYCMDVYEHKCLKELGDTFMFWINKKLEKVPSSWLYLFKGLFLEAKQQQSEAEAMYQKAIELANGSGKEIFRDRIKKMQKQLYNN